MGTVTRFPTLIRQKLAARLMLTVWRYMIAADTVLSFVIAILLFLSNTLTVEAFSTILVVSYRFLYICTSKQPNNSVVSLFINIKMWIFCSCLIEDNGCSHCHLFGGRTDGPCKPYSREPGDCVNQAETNHCSSTINALLKCKRSSKEFYIHQIKYLRDL